MPTATQNPTVGLEQVKLFWQYWSLPPSCAFLLASEKAHHNDKPVAKCGKWEVVGALAFDNTAQEYAITAGCWNNQLQKTLMLSHDPFWCRIDHHAVIIICRRGLGNLVKLLLDHTLAKGDYKLVQWLRSSLNMQCCMQVGIRRANSHVCGCVGASQLSSEPVSLGKLKPGIFGKPTCTCRNWATLLYLLAPFGAMQYLI